MKRLLPALVLLVAATAHAKTDYYHPEQGWTHATASATSSLDGTHGADRAVDGAPPSAWCAAKGQGTGEALTITFAAPITAASVDLNGGIFTRPPEKQRKPKPASVLVSIDGRPAQRVELTASGARLKVEAGTMTTLEIAFADVKPAKQAMVCLTEVVVIDDFLPVAALFTSDPAGVTALERGYAAIGAALVACDAAQLGATARFPLAAKYKHVDETRTSGGSWKRTDAFADAAALVQAKCDLPPFIGNPARDGKVAGSCRSSGIDRLVCTTRVRLAEVHWTLVWENAVWRITGVTIDSVG